MASTLSIPKGSQVAVSFGPLIEPALYFDAGLCVAPWNGMRSYGSLVRNPFTVFGANDAKPQEDFYSGLGGDESKDELSADVFGDLAFRLQGMRALFPQTSDRDFELAANGIAKIADKSYPDKTVASIFAEHEDRLGSEVIGQYSRNLCVQSFTAFLNLRFPHVRFSPVYECPDRLDVSRGATNDEWMSFVDDVEMVVPETVLSGPLGIDVESLTWNDVAEINRHRRAIAADGEVDPLLALRRFLNNLPAFKSGEEATEQLELAIERHLAFAKKEGLSLRDISLGTVLATLPLAFTAMLPIDDKAQMLAGEVVALASVGVTKAVLLLKEKRRVKRDLAQRGDPVLFRDLVNDVVKGTTDKDVSRTTRKSVIDDER